MIDQIETLHHTLAVWLVEEELLLRDAVNLKPPATLASRLDLWRTRLRAYERLECALNLVARTTPSEAPPAAEPVGVTLLLLAS
jgi:hypothetical protein